MPFVKWTVHCKSSRHRQSFWVSMVGLDFVSKIFTGEARPEDACCLVCMTTGTSIFNLESFQYVELDHIAGSRAILSYLQKSDKWVYCFLLISRIKSSLQMCCNTIVFFKIRVITFKFCCNTMISQPIPNFKSQISQKKKKKKNPTKLVVTTILHWTSDIVVCFQPECNGLDFLL